MSYSHVNIDDVKDEAPGFGLQSGQARHVRKELGAESIGLGHYRVKPGQTIEFGHRHKSMEEMYLCLSGGGSLRIDDDVVELKPLDVVYVAPSAWRAWRAGDDGLELVAFGTHVEGDDESEMEMGWWTD